MRCGDGFGVGIMVGKRRGKTFVDFVAEGGEDLRRPPSADRCPPLKNWSTD